MAAFTHRFRVRYHECDAQGVVFNANHLTYVDVALTELWREAFGSYHDALAGHGLDLVVVDVHAAFRKGVRFDEVVDLSMEIERFGRSSMTTRWASRVDGELRVEGDLVHVWVDPETAAPVEIPEPIRAVLRPFSTQAA